MAISPTPRKAVKKQVPEQQPELEEVQRYHAGSRANLIANLEYGQSYSEAIRLDLDTVKMEHAIAEKNKLKSIMSAAANRASKRAEGKFITEVGEFITASSGIVVTAVVSRIFV